VITSPQDSIAIATKDADVALRAAKFGFIAINPTTRAFGDTRHPDAILKDRPHSCQYYMQRGVLTGRNLIGDRVWDVMKIIDWALENLPVDTDKIVVTGNSGGGTVTLYSGAMDPRIKLCAPSSCFCSFEGSIGTIHHCPCNHIPYIMDLCNMGDIAGLVAPRKLLIINGDKDKIFPIAPAREEFKTTKAVYEAFGVADNCEMYVGDGPHRYFWAGFSDYYKRHF
jgi:dienelactone hydrolase